MLISFKELFEKHNFKLKGIVHCGASTGQERQHYDELGAHVIWIEAIPEVYNDLIKNIGMYPKQRAINACLGEVNGKEITFNVSNNEAQSSSYLPLGFHKTAHPEVHYVRTFDAITETLEQVLVRSGFPTAVYHGWLLVADLQGSEMFMLKGAANILQNFDGVYLEVNTKPVYEGCALKHEIEEFLSKYDFVPVEEFIYEQWGWGDQFFMKQELTK